MWCSWFQAMSITPLKKLRCLEQHGFAVDIVPGIAGETARPFPFMSRDDIASEMLRAAS